MNFSHVLAGYNAHRQGKGTRHSAVRISILFTIYLLMRLSWHLPNSHCKNTKNVLIWNGKTKKSGEPS